MKPKISVIVPIHNCEAFLGEALESLFAQNYPNLEVIVVDDGSTDRSLAVAKSFSSIRCLSEAHLGPAAARNAGLKVASGSIFGFIDGDDAWSSNHLDVLMPRLEDEAYDLVYGHIQQVGPSLRKADGTPDLLGPPIPDFGFGSGLIRAEAFHRVGWVNPDYRRGEDTEWFMRAREKQLRIQLCDQITLFYRQHDTNTTRDRRPVADLTLRIVKESLDRRRRGEAPTDLGPVDREPPRDPLDGEDPAL